MEFDSLASSLVQLKLAQTTSSVQYAVAAKLLQMQRGQGDAVTKLLQSAESQMNTAVNGVQRASSQLIDLVA